MGIYALENMLAASNLAYGREKKPFEVPNPHAHWHSIPRFSAPISVIYNEDYSDIALSLPVPESELADGGSQLIFADADFGKAVDLNNKRRINKTHRPIMEWFGEQMAIHSEKYLKTPGEVLQALGANSIDVLKFVRPENRTVSEEK